MVFKMEKYKNALLESIGHPLNKRESSKKFYIKKGEIIEILRHHYFKIIVWNFKIEIFN